MYIPTCILIFIINVRKGNNKRKCITKCAHSSLVFSVSIHENIIEFQSVTSKGKIPIFNNKRILFQDDNRLAMWNILQLIRRIKQNT